MEMFVGIDVGFESKLIWKYLREIDGKCMGK